MSTLSLQLIYYSSKFGRPTRYGTHRVQIWVGVLALFDITRPAVSVHYNCALAAHVSWVLATFSRAYLFATLLMSRAHFVH
jgi:hypothetical protein